MPKVPQAARHLTLRKCAFHEGAFRGMAFAELSRVDSTGSEQRRALTHDVQMDSVHMPSTVESNGAPAGLAQPLRQR